MKKPAPAPTPAPVAKSPEPVKVTLPVSPMAIAAPPLPISAEKHQKLNDLLAKDKADQLTPDEYQKQRAAILAEP